MRIVILLTALEGLVLTCWLMMRRRQASVALQTNVRLSPRAATNFDPRFGSRWAFVDESQAEGQSDDRSQMLSAVAAGIGSPAARRSSARRSHQLHFRKWSSERHD